MKQQYFPPLWRWALLSLFAIMLIAVPANPLFAALTPEGTVIGNSATATYFDDSNNPYTTTSNIVQTVVQEVCGVAVSAVASKTGVPGTTVYLPYILTNTGNGENTFNLTDNTGTYAKVYYLDENGNGVADAGEATTTSVTLGIDETTSIVVAVSIPAGAADGATDSPSFTATATAPGACAVNSVGTVTVTMDASIDARKDVSHPTAVPGDTLTYTVIYQNTGLKAAKSRDGYSVDTNDNNTLTADVEGILLKDTLDIGATYVDASASGTPTVNPTGYPVLSSDGVNWYRSVGGTLATVDDVLHVGFFLEDSASADNTQQDVLDIDQQGSFTFKVTVNDAYDGDDSFVDNTAVIEYADSTGADQSTTTNQVQTEIPDSAVADIAVGDFGNPEEDATGDFTDDNTASNVPAGSWVVFTHTAQNNGHATDVINLSVDAASVLPTGAIVEFWNADGSAKLRGGPDLGAVAAGASANFTVKVFIPAATDPATAPFKAIIKVTSTNKPSESDLSQDNILKSDTYQLESLGESKVAPFFTSFHKR